MGQGLGKEDKGGIGKDEWRNWMVVSNKLGKEKEERRKG
jgi:hypothetical protein